METRYITCTERYAEGNFYGTSSQLRSHNTCPAVPPNNHMETHLNSCVVHNSYTCFKKAMKKQIFQRMDDMRKVQMK
jgi:hypothetical protein